MTGHSWGLTTVTPDEQKFYKALGARIAQLRQDRELTQQQLADELGISQQIVAHYEVGRFRLPVYILPDLAGALGVSVSGLLDPIKSPSAKRKSSRRPPESHS